MQNQPDEQVALQPQLLAGERILWTGHPDPRRLLAPADAFLIPFSLLWGGFALFWEAGVLGLFGKAPIGVDVLFVLWGVPFVLVGQYFIWGRFLYKRRDRRRTIYAVTSQRVLVLRGRGVQSMFLEQLPTLNQHSRADGSGSIDFNSAPFGYGYWANTGMDFFGWRGTLAFYDIPQVANVYRLVAEARRGQNPPA